MASFNSLPVELLHHVCTYLSCKDVMELMLANRYYNTFLYSNLFQNVNIYHVGGLRLFIAASKTGQLNGTSFGLKTRTLKLTNSPITEEQLSALLNACPNITELDLDSTVWLFICPKKRGHHWHSRNIYLNHSLIRTFTKYTNLTSLSLDLTGYASQTIDIYHILSLLYGLKSLQLISAFHIFSMNDMEKIHTYCPRLVDLSISGYCLNRLRPALPIIQSLTLRHLSIKFSSGWTYYYNWLWYIGHKYTGLYSVTCECTATMGIRSANPTDEQEMLDGFTVFAERNALTLKNLGLINLIIDGRLMEALESHNVNETAGNTDTTTEFMDLDNGHTHNTTTAVIPAPQTKAITSARFSNHTTFIRSEVFLAFLQYVQDTIRTLNISWPLMDIGNIELSDSLNACKFLTDLTIELPGYMFGLVDGQGNVPFDRILRCCPLLVAFHIIHGKLFLEDHPMATKHQTNQPAYPLKSLILDSVYVPTCFMIMETHGLLNLERIALDHCIVYDLERPNPSDPTIVLDWLFPIPPLPNGGPLCNVPRHPLSVSIYHTHFVNPDTGRTSLLCDYISLSQHGKGKEQSWCVRSNYVQKVVRLSSPMLRRKSGQLKRKNNRRQAPSEHHDGETPTTPNVGLLISCYSMDSLRVNERELI